ncbi:hypothetical protein A5724_19550 [Mycobacterium sp. ACS1612]|uniref:toll/interleukin-1 receptor domain-containing protein n=1 Tax=Mycobacterium sp. ACS1612 TaxID=1834117 RepID=UPI0007FC18F6|nr:toll/interleukin-1 receptor domain-containing protein [Mycobacterium sp. ACS1612]OBF33266.1 hypothetical protein A5724_19550 [Mycobacterium sp. ACS1612]
MAIEQDLKIFISWSGDLAREITKVLRDWLPKMFDHIDPWASEVDIDAGMRGLDVIQDRLNASSFGIIVVTTENMNKPWLNFEAGALSKRLEEERNPVVPLLVNFENVYDLQGPVSQFQAIKLDQTGMRGLCRSIAAVIGLDPLKVDARFLWAWPDLEKSIAQAKHAAGKQPEVPPVDEKDLLRGIFSAVRTLEKQVVALSNSVPVVSIPLSPNVNAVKHGRSPWHDGQLMQAIQDEIEQIASQYKPVRYVTPMERKGEKVLGVMFADGEGLSQGQFKDLMNQTRGRGVTVAVLTDRELDQS